MLYATCLMDPHSHNTRMQRYALCMRLLTSTSGRDGARNTTRTSIYGRDATCRACSKSKQDLTQSQPCNKSIPTHSMTVADLQSKHEREPPNPTQQHPKQAGTTLCRHSSMKHGAKAPAPLPRVLNRPVKLSCSASTHENNKTGAEEHCNKCRWAAECTPACPWQGPCTTQIALRLPVNAGLNAKRQCAGKVHRPARSNRMTP